MENKIITEEDFWECTGGMMPAPFQSGQKLVYTNGNKAKKYITKADKSTLSWVDYGCKKLMLLYAIAAAIAAAIACLCAATGGAALIAICAIASAVGAAWGAVVGSLICGQMVAMAREWLTSKDDFQILGIHTITGKDKMICNAFTFIGMSPEFISYKPNVKSWSQAISLGVANFIGEVLKGMMAGACIGAAAAAISGIATAATSGGWAGVGKAVLGFIKSVPTNFIVNIAESISGIGLALRGTMSAQSALATYGELGEETTKEDINNALTQGFFAMEIGTYESGKNIVSGNGTLEDYAGLALNFTPAGKGVRDLFPHSPGSQRMGIVPESFANKMDADSGSGRVPDADTAGKKSTTDAETSNKPDEDGMNVKKQGRSGKKAEGQDGKAYEKKLPEPEFELYTTQDGTTVKRLKPDFEYESNRYQYKTDAQGRIIEANGNLRLEKGGRNNYAQRTVGKNDGRLAGDHGGHIFGDQFGGSGGKENMVPMDGETVNNYHKGEYGQMEQRWAEELSNGSEVEVTVKNRYSDDTSRPSHFEVTETIDGETSTTVIINTTPSP